MVSRYDSDLFLELFQQKCRTPLVCCGYNIGHIFACKTKTFYPKHITESVSWHHRHSFYYSTSLLAIDNPFDSGNFMVGSTIRGIHILTDHHHR